MKTKAAKFFTSKKYSEFIEDFEDKWLQFASPEQRMKAFFGNLPKAKKVFKEWKNGKELFSKEAGGAFPEPFRFS